MRAPFLLALALLVLVLFAEIPSGESKKKKKKKKKKSKPKKTPLTVVPRQSRFGKRLDSKALDALWFDDEDDIWHEDSWDWKMKKTEYEYKEIFDAASEMPQPNTPGFNPDDWIEAAALQKSRGYNEYEVEVATRNRRETEELSRLYVDVMKTNGIMVGSMVKQGEENDNVILFSQEDGHFNEFRDFLMGQPVVNKMVWGDDVYYPEGKAPPEPPKRPNAALDPNWKPPISLDDLPPPPEGFYEEEL